MKKSPFRCAKRSILMIIAAIMITMLNTNCATMTSELREINIFAMDTFMSVKACNADDEVMRTIEEKIYCLDSSLSTMNPDSDIAKLNENAIVEASNETIELLEMSKEMCKATDKALEISLYPVTLLWGFTTKDYRVPAQAEIDEALELVDFTQIVTKNGIVQINEGMKIDLGAVAKGYASEKICGILRENGVTSALVNLGGNIQTIGKRPDGKKWRVGVKNPFKTDENLLVVEIENSAVVTSGNYERYFETDGKRYCHIIDSFSGYPVDNGIASITIIGKNGFKCDALSTALYVMGKEKAVEYWQNSNDFEMIIVTNADTIFITEGILANCTNESGMNIETINRE